VYLRLGCTSTLTYRDRAKCSITSPISCVNCSGDSSGGEIGIGRAGDVAGETGQAGETGRAGETERAGGGGGDKRADGCGGSGEFEQAGDGGDGRADRIGAPACA